MSLLTRAQLTMQLTLAHHAESFLQSLYTPSWCISMMIHHVDLECACMHVAFHGATELRRATELRQEVRSFVDHHEPQNSAIRHSHRTTSTASWHVCGGDWAPGRAARRHKSSFYISSCDTSTATIWCQVEPQDSIALFSYRMNWHPRRRLDRHVEPQNAITLFLYGINTPPRRRLDRHVEPLDVTNLFFYIGSLYIRGGDWCTM